MTKKQAPKPPAPAIEINPGFRRALDIMEGTDRHVFIGKTFEGVRAYCHKRGECRTFRLDRMLEVTAV